MIFFYIFQTVESSIFLSKKYLGILFILLQNFTAMLLPFHPIFFFAFCNLVIKRNSDRMTHHKTGHIFSSFTFYYFETSFQSSKVVKVVGFFKAFLNS